MTQAANIQTGGARRTLRILGRALRGFSQDGCFQLAGAISFFTLLSFIPLIVLLLSFLTLVVRSSENLTDMVLEGLQTYFPLIPPDFIRQVGDLLSHAGALGGLASVFLLMTAQMVFAAVQNGLNRVFGSRGRPFYRSWLVSLGLILATGAFLALIVTLATVTTAVGGLLEGFRPLDGYGTMVYKLLITYALPLLLMAAVFTVAIKGVPNRHVGLREAAIAGAFGAVLWEGGQHLFTWYVANVAPYQLVYGSLGALVAGLIWIQYSASILLLSAELAAILIDEDARAGGGPGDKARRR
ncbi:MAG: YihY/virulence factor BrkB family protein [Deltaproteobacteria bacterium]|nr:YihY/virulence factor BrkB family protein [Deltaproteobacteria bacterium]